MADNLLEKASILLTPTAYNDGSMLSVKPENGDGDFTFSRGSAATRVNAQGLVENVQIISDELVSNGNFSQEGSELVTNGDFATDSDWNKGTSWTITNGKAISDGLSNNSFSQDGILTIGKTYKLTFDVVDYTSGTLLLLGAYYETQVQLTSSDSYTIFIVPTQNNLTFYASSFIGSIDNISVKEVGQDWQLGTGWSIGDGKALSDGVSSNSNLVTTSAFYSGSTPVKMTINVTDYVSGGLKIFLSSINFTEITANGNYTFYTTADRSDGKLYLKSNNFTGSISNISVKEITHDTDLPRINYEGFSYQDSLGSELLTSGNDTSNIVGLADNQNINIQSSFLTLNKTYKITFEIYDYVEGSIFLLRPNNLGAGTAVSANGTYSYTVLANASISLIFRTDGLSTTLKLKNISVKEVLGQEVVPDSGCGSWLLEPQSTNLLTYSSDYTQSFWNKLSSPTITANYGLSPDGQNNSTRIQGNSSTAVYAAGTYATSNFDRSIYIKATSGSGDIQLLSHNTNTNNVFTINENWQRFDINSLTSGTGNNVFYALDMRGASTDIYDIEIWGAQSEEQSYATSYIPTNGIIATRLADEATNSGNSTLINSTEGVLYAEIGSLKGDSASNREISLSDGTTGNSLRIYFPVNYENKVTARLELGGSFAWVGSVDVASKPSKVALRYNSSGLDFFVNGVKELTTTTLPNFTNSLSSLQFRRGDGSTGSDFYGKAKALAVYKEALTDEQLQSLTTI